MNNEDQFKVMSFQIGQTKNGKTMWRIGLQKLGEENVLTGVVWSEDIPRFDGAKFKVGNIIKFLGQDYNSNYNSVVIKNVTVLKEALSGMPEVVATACLKDINNCIDCIIASNMPEEGMTADNIQTLKNIPLLSLAKEIKKFVNDDKFLTTPAAEKYHHNYIGGLLKHTHEVLEIVSQLKIMFPIENIDALMLAAILHDIGKCFEYETDLKLGTATTDKDFIHNQFSHIMWGTQLAQSHGAYDVARMVASHHGKIEWGALIEPETNEEKVLHLADMLSATTGITTIDKLEKLVEEILAGPQEEVQEEIKEETSDACKNDSNIL